MSERDWPFGFWLDVELYPHIFGTVGYEFGHDGAKFYLPRLDEIPEVKRGSFCQKFIMDRTYVSGNIFIRRNRMVRAGDFMVGHCHGFDHTTIVYKGALLIELDGIPTIVPSPYFRDKIPDELNYPIVEHHVLIIKDVSHFIKAIVDDTEFDCVYSLRNPQGEIIEQFQIDTVGVYR